MIQRLLIISLFIQISFVAAQNTTEPIKIIDKKVSFGHTAANNRTIDAVVVHSTFNNSGGDYYDIDLVIKQFKRYDVAAHYVIGRNGEIYLLVDEKNIVYHAGKSKLPDGSTNVNTRSIGIELMTSYTEGPTEKQLEALLSLIDKIKKEHTIKYVLRHSDIAPGRKTDPWNMDWNAFQKRLSLQP
jgi:N-acetyl-anhydromuramyl-L-alanine amidase AmpD